MLVNEVALGNVKVRGCPRGGLRGVGTKNWFTLGNPQFKKCVYRYVLGLLNYAAAEVSNLNGKKGCS